MSPDRWKRVEEIFLKVVERPREERTEYLLELCEGNAQLQSEVESLLAYDKNADADLMLAVAQAAASLVRQEAISGRGAIAGQRVGPYQLIRSLGGGGMSEVYLGVRANQLSRKLVAVKVIPQGLDTHGVRQRLRHERQILSSLQHPYIAKLIDGGTTASGQPYFVMEYVPGLPVNRYCESRRLDLRTRCQLFGKICDAVGYAHRNRVIHRDLKPANILVTPRGTPKLLDFGIAKLLDGNTAPLASGALTPDYASPEQVAGGPVTAASDVYSLGVVLFEILTGARAHPLDSYTPSEVERVICQLPVERPSVAAEGKSGEWRRSLEGPLDRIVLTALEKQPASRYASVQQLSADLAHYLEHGPASVRL